MEATAIAKNRIEVNSKREAKVVIDKIFPTDYAKDEKSTELAGYPIYRSTAEGHFYDYICWLGDRYEINLSDGRTVNVWMSEAFLENERMTDRINKLEEYIEELKTEIFFLNREKEQLSDENTSLKEANAELKRESDYFEAMEKKLADRIEAIKNLL